MTKSTIPTTCDTNAIHMCDKQILNNLTLAATINFSLAISKALACEDSI